MAGIRTPNPISGPSKLSLEYCMPEMYKELNIVQKKLEEIYKITGFVEKDVIKTAFEEKNKVQDIPEEAQKKKPRTKTKKTTVKKPKVKPNNKSEDTNSKNINKEKTIETGTEDIHREVREIKSSSPIEVTQIDENTSSKKPKKKGWWS